MMVFAGILMLNSCEQDHSINTTNLEGNWFVSRIELTNATNIDDEDYKTRSASDYDVNNPRIGCMVFIVTATSDFNHYNVTMYKHDGTTWNKVNTEKVVLGGNNKFTFNTYKCKFRKLEKNKNYMDIKVQMGNEIFRYYFHKTTINP